MCQNTCIYSRNKKQSGNAGFIKAAHSPHVFLLCWRWHFSMLARVVFWTRCKFSTRVHIKPAHPCPTSREAGCSPAVMLLVYVVSDSFWKWLLSMCGKKKQCTIWRASITAGLLQQEGPLVSSCQSNQHVLVQAKSLTDYPHNYKRYFSVVTY